MNVYDFDNTIYDGESTLHLFFFYMRRRPSLVKKLPEVLKAFARYKRGEVTLDDMTRVYAPMIEEIVLDVVDFDNDARVFWDGHIKRIKPFYAGIRRDDDLIITASPDFTIEEVCRRLGIKRFLSSTIDRETGKIGRICMRSNKIKYFFEEYGDEKIEDFYTDSEKNDRPLIDAAERAFIVKGNKITRIK